MAILISRNKIAAITIMADSKPLTKLIT
jgi:hypothetical protein